MSKKLVSINETQVTVKEYQGQRVVTLSDIDTVHNRPKGTAHRNFNKNRNHLIKGEDYFVVGSDEIRQTALFSISDNDHRDKILVTEFGYFMIVKSFKDDLAWQVQRQLVNSYFNTKTEKRVEIPERQTSSLPAPVAKTWYDRNRPLLYEIGRKYNCNMKTIIKHILVHLNSKFDIKEAKRIYKEQTGYDLEYNLDLLDFFPEMEEVTDKFVDKMLNKN